MTYWESEFYESELAITINCKSCKERNCSYAIDQRDDYCSNHQNICNNCHTRIPQFESYCLRHQVACQQDDCQERLYKDEIFCLKHAKRCSEPYCNYLCDTDPNYCRVHRDRTCWELGCRTKIKYDQQYCERHSRICLNCSTKIRHNETYCSYHQDQIEAKQAKQRAEAERLARIKQEQLQEQNRLQNLVKQRTTLTVLQEVVKFSAWWNNNLATVINGSGSYTVWLLVYEPAEKNRSEILQKFEINNGYNRYSLDSTKAKASGLRIELNGEYPILALHPQANIYTAFNNIIKNPYVVKVEVPCDKKMHYENGFEYFSGRGIVVDALSNEPEKYLKPLDVVWVKKDDTSGNKYYHVGVYIGNGEVCHYSGKDKKQYKAKLIITNWKKFVEGYDNGEVFAYHPIIPFKHYKKIAHQISWAYNDGYWQEKYCLANNNCEHRANSFVFGINYSKQVWERPSEAIDNCQFWRGECKGNCKKRVANNNKNSIKLDGEINQTNDQLNESSNYWYEEIKNQYETNTVIPPKDCKIM